ncbi:hypothetical protein BB559_001425 [Furculomyces boomerangus]|uniref:Amino acid transporter transmembrane domain-containing protein n=2 Tax=Harpellales TaxID=61421 RepID=A0A2T9Z1W9_9FUNG|nr:hypothetical protein BB559_001425 [Furculomyces boomerangus]PWA03620.1 hypothetical protein BB558_000266 [Smittium angustum]
MIEVQTINDFGFTTDQNRYQNSTKEQRELPRLELMESSSTLYNPDMYAKGNSNPQKTKKKRRGSEKKPVGSENQEELVLPLTTKDYEEMSSSHDTIKYEKEKVEKHNYLNRTSVLEDAYTAQTYLNEVNSSQHDTPINPYFNDDRSRNMIRLQKSKRLSKLREVNYEGAQDKKHALGTVDGTEDGELLSDGTEEFDENEDFYWNDGSRPAQSDNKTISTYVALFLYLCVTINVGALQVPFAFTTGGWLTILFMLIAMVASMITGIMSYQCLEFNQGVYKRNFHHIAKLAFGRTGYRISLILSNINIMSSCITLLSVIGNILGFLFQNRRQTVDKRIWELLFSAFILLQFLVLRKFSGFAAIGAVGGIFAVFMVLLYGIMGFIIKDTYEITSSAEGYYNFNSIKYDQLGLVIPNTSFSSIYFPVSMAFSAFSFGGTPIHTIIQQNMTTPKNWPVVLFVGSIVAAFCLILFGSGMYHSLGNIASLGIVPYQLPINDLSRVTYFFTIAHSLILIPIYFYTISYDWESSFQLNKSNAYRSHRAIVIIRIFLRCLLWVVMLILACFIPKSYQFFNVLSVFSSGIVYYIIPASCYLTINGWKSCSKVEKLGTILVISVGIIVSLFGTAGSAFYFAKGTQVK